MSLRDWSLWISALFYSGPWSPAEPASWCMLRSDPHSQYWQQQSARKRGGRVGIKRGEETEGSDQRLVSPQKHWNARWRNPSSTWSNPISAVRKRIECDVERRMKSRQQHCLSHSYNSFTATNELNREADKHDERGESETEHAWMYAAAGLFLCAGTERNTE